MTAHVPYLWMLIALPLAGAIINGLFGKRLPRDFVASLACSTVGVAFAFSILLFFDLKGFDAIAQTLFTWISIDRLSIDFSLRLDQLSALMCLVVTGVSFLIHVYSVGYMKDDRSFARYFAYLNLFVFAMLLLVTADNLAVMFIGWEGVGLCSYLLIGFWYDDPAKAAAGTKAFIANRIGDAGFLAGIILTFWRFCDGKVFNLSFTDFAEKLQGASLNDPYITAIAVCFFIGAMGKSAQIPLYVWLPDAMAGPTPVSALIHAATMVTAGVYMVARLNFLYAVSPDAMMLVSGIGAATALFAAIIAVGQNDIKKVLAYSTISQLGYMFVAVGVGAYTAGMFHLTTHAFFKACLFLCAGAVIHALHGEQDIRKMGGLRKRMPGVYWAFIISAAALAGIIPLSGFWSKDDILWSALLFKHSAVPVWWRYALWLTGIFTAFLTAFYMARLAFLAFFGKERQSVELHPTPLNMKFAIYLLAILAAVGGILNTPIWPGLEHYLAPIFDSSAKVLAQSGVAFGFSASAAVMMAVTLIIALGGIALAWHFYIRRADIPGKLAQSWKRTYSLLTGKFYVDEIYRALLYRPLAWLAEKFFGKKIEDGIISGSMKMCAALFDGIGEKLRELQSGKLSHYLLAMLAGLIFLLLFLL